MASQKRCRIDTLIDAHAWLARREAKNIEVVCCNVSDEQSQGEVAQQQRELADLQIRSVSS